MKTIIGNILRAVDGKSLRGRYLAATTLVAIVVFTSVWAAQLYVTETGRTRTANFEIRNNITKKVRLLRNSLLHMGTVLESYLWSPTGKHREAVHASIDETIEKYHSLVAIERFRPVNMEKGLQSLGTDLFSLHETLDKLMDTRINTGLRYPAMNVLSATSYVNNQEFLTISRVALQELLNRNGGERRLEFHRRISEVRDTWLRMIAEFRLYVANHNGTIVEGAEEQEKNIELLFQQSINGIDSLLTEDEDMLGLETEHALTEMLKAARLWYGGYERIRTLHEENDWRGDIHYLKSTIEPLFQDIWSFLKKIDLATEELAGEDVTVLVEAAGSIAFALWVLALFTLGVFIMGFVYFDRSVLKPVAIISEALRRDTAEGSTVELPRAGSRETRYLLDAYLQMRQQVRERQTALEHQALHDRLTDLPNRALLNDRMQQSIRQAMRERSTLALLIIGLDRFKDINDILGHQKGDELLRHFSERLPRLLGDTDTAARLSGDEFAILLPDGDRAHAKKFGLRLLEMLEQPFEVDKQTVYLNCSIGIALFPEHSSTPHKLSQCANTAMLLAKQRKQDILVYDGERDDNKLHRLSLASDLREAVYSSDIRVVYQPQIDLKTNRFVGMEALARWNHPERGAVRTDELISVAERTGLIRPLTYKILDTVLGQCSIWQEKRLDFGVVAVNLSMSNLQDSAFINQLQRLVDKWQVSPQCLILEITENSMMSDPAHALDTLHRINALGIQLAVDDFGTGFSSLAYLKKLPVHKLKIDKSFVTDMINDQNDAVIVRSVIDLAHNLGLQVIAEGVESEEVKNLLYVLECDAAQGYFVGEPLDAEDIEHKLQPQKKRELLADCPP